MGLAGAGDDALQPGLEQYWRLSNDIEGADHGAVTLLTAARLSALGWRSSKTSTAPPQLSNRGGQVAREAMMGASYKAATSGVAQM